MGEENGLLASGYLLRAEAETEIIINVSVGSGRKNSSLLFSSNLVFSLIKL